MSVTSWRHAFRVGFAPQFSVDQLRDLRAALVRDDPKLIQGKTVIPRLCDEVGDAKPVGACGISYIGWHSGEGLSSILAVEDWFGEVCHKADQLLKEPAACRYFLNFFDDTPRDEMRPLLIAEIDRELEQRVAPKDPTDLLTVDAATHSRRVETSSRTPVGNKAK